MTQLGRAKWSTLSGTRIVCCALAVAGLCARGGAAAELDPNGPRTLKERIEENRQARRIPSELSLAGQQALEALCDESQRLGRMPTLTEFTAILEHPAAPLESDGGRADYENLRWLFDLVQKTGPIKAEILADVQRMREAIRSLRIHYNTKETFAGQTEPILRTADFAWQGEEFFFEWSPGRAVGTDREIEACDGEVVRSLHVDSDSKTGSIRKLGDRGRFFDLSRNPWILTGLIDAKKFEVGAHHDFIQRAGTLVVYETHEVIDGMECVVLGSNSDRYYLCPALGHALVGYDSGPVLDKKTGRLVARPNQATKRSTGLTKYGEGIWLPDRVEEIYREAGKLKLRRVVEVTRWQVNEKLDPALFRDVIPVGTLVADSIRRDTYTQK